MPYAFRRKDRSVQAGARRIAAEQIDRALGRLDGPGQPSAEDIHALRTTVKRLRGLVRLVRPGFAHAKAEDAALRDAARAVSSQRDSEVMLATLDTLAPDGLPALRAALTEAHRAAHAEGTLDSGLATYRVAMQAVRLRSHKWKVRSQGFATLEKGLSATFGHARKDWHAARRSGAPEALHECRKRIKAHGYQARLLAPIWPEMMAAHRAVVDDLGEQLGLMNDLTVFAGHLARLDLPAAERDRAAALAQARYAKLMEDTLPRADRLLSERPEALAQRWKGWWETWRKEG